MEIDCVPIPYVTSDIAYVLSPSSRAYVEGWRSSPGSRQGLLSFAPFRGYWGELDMLTPGLRRVASVLRPVRGLVSRT